MVAATAGRIVPAWGTFLDEHPEYFWATLTGLAAIALLLSGGYKRLEKVTTALVALVTLITVACVAGLPWTDYPVRWDELATGLRRSRCRRRASPWRSRRSGSRASARASCSPIPYWCIEKGYARVAGPRSDDEDWGRRARGWLRVMQLDAWFSMVVFTVATVAFYLLGAAVLHPQGLDPKGAGMIATLSQMYVKPLGALDARGLPRSAPGPSCSRRSTSPRPPTAG